jgi:hypothetical protein
LLLAACSASPKTERNGPVQNPYLAVSYNNQGHWNDAATDATTIAVPKGHFRATPDSTRIVPNDGLGIPAYMAEIDGHKIYWFFAGTSMRKLVWRNDDFEEIDRINLPVRWPNYTRISAQERLKQSRDVETYLQSKDEAGLFAYLKQTPNRQLSAVNDQVAQGILYSLFTKDHALIGSNARGLIRISNQEPTDPFSPLADPEMTRLPNHLFDNEKVKRLTIFPSDVVFGLKMSYNGYLVINTLGGKIITLDRNTFEVVDIYEAQGQDEIFSNGFASSPELSGGAIYVASNRFMYRLAITKDGSISDAAQDGAWRAAYDFGRRLPLGKIADGTGATPTLMGFGPEDDELVVITDGADRMRLVAFWRNDIPTDATPPEGAKSERIADQTEVKMAKQGHLQSEQSVVIHGPHAFVVNGVPEPNAKPYPTRQAYFRGLVAGMTRKPPTGAAMYRWDTDANRWRHSWTRNDIGVFATVPFISVPSEMVIVNGVYKEKLGSIYHLGLDLNSGETVMSIDSGANPIFNGTFTSVKCDLDGSLMYTAMFGLIKMDVSKMTPIESPG